MVDVVMASYNGGKYIREQIDSIMNQSYEDVRLIIRDDGSKDSTVAIIHEYEEKYPGRVVYVSDEVKCGSSRSNFMQAMKYAKTDYIMFSDQDDFWLPYKIQHSLDRMQQIERRIGKDKPILVFGSYKPVDGDLRDIKDNASDRQEAAYKLEFSNLLVQNYVNGCLMMINRTLADLMGEYDDSILMHDWWAALIAAGCGAVEHVDEIMMLYRQHGDNVVGSVNVKSLKYRIKKAIDPETRNANKLYLKQAELLQKRLYYHFVGKHKEELDRFIGLYSRTKIMRMISLVRGRYLKSDIVRILGQLFYI